MIILRIMEYDVARYRRQISAIRKEISLKELVQDYKIKVVDIRRLADTSVFQTDVRQVFDFIRFAEKKKDLYELINNDSYYQNMEEDAFEVLVKYANIKE